MITFMYVLHSLLIGMAIPTLLLWPLPLLHGRKTYVVLSVCLLLPLQLPQALPLLVEDMSVSTIIQQTYTTPSYASIVLTFRCISGVILGFLHMNIFAFLTDIWGIDTGRCCRAGVYSPSELGLGDKRRRESRGGGLGAWLGLWAAVMVGGTSMGYCFGTIMDQSLHPS